MPAKSPRGAETAVCPSSHPRHRLRRLFDDANVTARIDNIYVVGERRED